MEIVKRESRGRWYTPEGVPISTMIGKNGKERVVTARDARAQNLLPSVTSVLSILERPALTSWRVEQGILASLTLPRIEGENELEFAKRVAKDAEEASKSAMGLGTKVHACLELSLKGESIPDELVSVVPLCAPVIEWFKKSIVPESIECELRLVSTEYGFAGTTDIFAKLRDGRTALIDYKTQGKEKITFYDEWLYQISAYSLIKKADCLINIGISTVEPYFEIKEWSPEEVMRGMAIFTTTLKLFKIIKGV